MGAGARREAGSSAAHVWVPDGDFTRPGALERAASRCLEAPPPRVRSAPRRLYGGRTGVPGAERDERARRRGAGGAVPGGQSRSRRLRPVGAGHPRAVSVARPGVSEDGGGLGAWRAGGCGATGAGRGLGGADPPAASGRRGRGETLKGLSGAAPGAEGAGEAGQVLTPRASSGTGQAGETGPAGPGAGVSSQVGARAGPGVILGEKGT